MREVCYWQRSKNGPRSLAAVLDDGSFVVVDLDAHGWQAKAAEIDENKTIGKLTQSPKTKLWSGEFKCPYGTGFVREYGTPRCAATALLEIYNQIVADEEAIRNDPVAHLERELRRCDWYSHYSDDHRFFAAGESHMKLIRELLQKVPQKIAKVLWKENAPSEFPFPCP
jgi:hypothetical protein